MRLGRSRDTGRPLIVAKAEQQRHEMKGDQYARRDQSLRGGRRQLIDTTEIQEGAVKQHGDWEKPAS